MLRVGQWLAVPDGIEVVAARPRSIGPVPADLSQNVNVTINGLWSEISGLLCGWTRVRIFEVISLMGRKQHEAKRAVTGSRRLPSYTKM